MLLGFNMYLYETILPTLFGTLVGGFFTWLAAWIYYKRAGHELASEAEKLRGLNVLILRALESAGLAEFSRDDEGNIKGMKIKISGSIYAGPATVKGSAKVISNKDK